MYFNMYTPSGSEAQGVRLQIVRRPYCMHGDRMSISKVIIPPYDENNTSSIYEGLTVLVSPRYRLDISCCPTADVIKRVACQSLKACPIWPEKLGILYEKRLSSLSVSSFCSFTSLTARCHVYVKLIWWVFLPISLRYYNV